MTPTAVLALAVASAPGWTGVHPPIEYAEQAFGAGARLRYDAATARRVFATAADRFDQTWREGARTPALALNRGRAHFLAGDVPRAIRAFHDGLALAPYDADLLGGLAAARATVAYPVAAAPAERTRPDPVAGLRNRVAPWDLFRFAAGCGVLVVVGLGKRLTTHPGWAGPVAAVGGVGWLAVAAAGWQMHRERAADAAAPVAVVAADGATLRTGNGDAFPPRTEARLPRGAEIRLLARRGGWAQVELPGGAVGWLPEGAVLSGS